MLFSPDSGIISPMCESRIYYLHRGVAQPGSVLAWGASGRRFKSFRPDHIQQGFDDSSEYQKQLLATLLATLLIFLVIWLRSLIAPIQK